MSLSQTEVSPMPSAAVQAEAAAWLARLHGQNRNAAAEQGFRRWLERRLPSAESEATARQAPETAGRDPAGILAALSRTDRWWEDTALAEAARPPLLRLCAVYLTAANGGKGPSDPVARFHLGNGARLERLDWLGDVSVNGLAQSAGFMVNYLYDLDAVERNHEAYANQNEIVASAALRRAHRNTTA